MKFAVTIFLSILAMACLGQKYHTCYVYKYEGNDTGNKKLIITKKYNSKGRLTFEKYHELFFPITDANGNSLDSIHREYRYYYIEDSILTSSVQIGGIMDTIITHYSYNNSHQLLQTIDSFYEFYYWGESPNDTVRGWATHSITNYEYDKNNNNIRQVEKIFYKEGGLKINLTKRSYDNKNRIIKQVDSTSNRIYDSSDKSTIKYEHVSTREYKYYLDREESYYQLLNGRPDTTVIYYVRNREGKIIEELEKDKSDDCYHRYYKFLPEKRLVKQSCYDNYNQKLKFTEIYTYQ